MLNPADRRRERNGFGRSRGYNTPSCRVCNDGVEMAAVIGFIMLIFLVVIF